MPIRSVLVLDRRRGAWGPFPQDYFSDIPATVVAVEEASQAAAVFDHSLSSRLFTESTFLNESFLPEIRVHKNTDPAFRAFFLGGGLVFSKDSLRDVVFSAAPSVVDFDKRFAETLPMLETTRLLIVEDEAEIGTMVRDYSEGRRAPAFEITCVTNGREAFEVTRLKQPDVIILDIKMSVMEGCGFYAQIRTEKRNIPVIVFFNSISGEALSEICRYDNPPVIEKGYKGSSLSAMMALVKNWYI